MGRIGIELVVGPDEEEPRTLPGPLNLPEEEEVKGLFTFFMNPFILSFMSSIPIETQQFNSIQFNSIKDDLTQFEGEKKNSVIWNLDL